MRSQFYAPFIHHSFQLFHQIKTIQIKLLAPKSMRKFWMICLAPIPSQSLTFFFLDFPIDFGNNQIMESLGNNVPFRVSYTLLSKNHQADGPVTVEAVRSARRRERSSAKAWNRGTGVEGITENNSPHCIPESSFCV